MTLPNGVIAGDVLIMGLHFLGWNLVLFLIESGIFEWSWQWIRKLRRKAFIENNKIEVDEDVR